MLTPGPTIWWAPGDDDLEAIHLGPTTGKLRHGLESFQWLMDVSIPVFKLLCNSNLMVFVFNPQLFVKIPIRVWKLLHLSKTPSNLCFGCSFNELCVCEGRLMVTSFWPNKLNLEYASWMLLGECMWEELIPSSLIGLFTSSYANTVRWLFSIFFTENILLSTQNPSLWWPTFDWYSALILRSSYDLA